MVTNILFADPYHLSRPLGWGQWVEIQLFQNMIIKCSNMVANILSADPYSLLPQPPPPPPPPDPRVGSIGQNSAFFRIWSLNAATW